MDSQQGLQFPQRKRVAILSESLFLPSSLPLAFRITQEHAVFPALANPVSLSRSFQKPLQINFPDHLLLLLPSLASAARPPVAIGS